MVGLFFPVFLIGIDAAYLVAVFDSRGVYS